MSSYAQSSLWTSDEWQERVHLGWSNPSVPTFPRWRAFRICRRLSVCSHELPTRVALDNYEAAAPLNASLPDAAEQVVLAFGPERGWSPNERACLRNNGWKLAHLGPHVLRAETATVAALSATAAQLGYWREQTETGL